MIYRPIGRFQIYDQNFRHFFGNSSAIIGYHLSQSEVDVDGTSFTSRQEQERMRSSSGRTSIIWFATVACFAASASGSWAGVRQTPAIAEASAMAFVKIEPGSFRMGCSTGDVMCDSDENPPHLVKLTKAFEMGKFEVTQSQWQAVMMGRNQSRFKGDDLPVETISWIDVQQFMDRMNARNDGYRYRLPTEAEWEYAARAGSTGPNTGPVGDVAWYNGNSEGHSHPVGQKKANAWGLHDMEGNVYEWTQDWYFDYEQDPVADPTGPEMGYERVPRGGSWDSSPRGIRTSNRNMAEPPDRNYNIGFRCVRIAIPK